MLKDSFKNFSSILIFMTKEYFHYYPKDPVSRMLGEVLREETILYDGKNVLVVQKRMGGNTFILVPGEVVETTAKGAARFSRVNVIGSKEDKDGIEQQIHSMGLEGRISFW